MVLDAAIPVTFCTITFRWVVLQQGPAPVFGSLRIQSPPAPLQSHASCDHPLLRGCLHKEGNATEGRSRAVGAHSKPRTCTPSFGAFNFLFVVMNFDIFELRLVSFFFEMLTLLPYT
jgi:hypothetical protein